MIISKSVKLVGAVALTFSLLLSQTLIVKADPIEDVKDKQAQYKEIEKEIEVKESELYKLVVEMEPLMQENEKNQNDIEKLNVEIEKIEKEIEKYEKDIKDKEVVLGERIRELYKSGGAFNYLTIFMGAGNLKDLLARLDSTNMILDIDRDSIEELTKIQEELNGKIESNKQKRMDLNRLNAETKRGLKEFEEKKSEYDKIIKEIESELAKFDEEYLSKAEDDLVQGYIDIINNPDSKYSDIEAAITQLKNIRDKQLKSPIVIESANNCISKGENILAEMDVANADPKIGADIISTATLYLGHEYVYNTAGPTTFDCSGFTQYVFGLHGYTLKRTTFDQITQGVEVKPENLQPGDLVFSYSLGHVGIYIGNGKQIHAANETLGVIISPVVDFYGARRII